MKDDEHNSDIRRGSAAAGLCAAGALLTGVGGIVGCVLATLGNEFTGGGAYEEIMMPLSLAAAERCDGVLRIGGDSGGADLEVEAIRSRAGIVYRSLAEVPEVTGSRREQSRWQGR